MYIATHACTHVVITNVKSFGGSWLGDTVHLTSQMDISSVIIVVVNILGKWILTVRCMAISSVILHLISL